MKIVHVNKPGFFIQKCRIAIAVLAFYFCCTSCRKGHEPDEHASFVNAAYKMLDTASNKFSDHTFLFIDSAFRTLSNPAPGDIFLNDSVKEIYYRDVAHDYIKALSRLDNLIALTKDRTAEEKYAERYAAALYDKGFVFWVLKRNDEAFHYVSLAEDAVIKSVKNKCNLALYSGWKANLQFEQQKYLLSAASYLEQSRFLKAECDNGSYLILKHLTASLNNTALSYLRAGMPDSAIWYEHLALQKIGEIETRYGVTAETVYSKAVVYGDQAEVLALKGKYAEAVDLYNKSIAGCVKLDTGYIQKNYVRLAELYFKINDNDAAFKTLELLKNSLARLNKYNQTLAQWYKLTASYYARTNEPARAYEYQETYIAIMDSIETRSKKLAVTDVGKEFENMELKYSNEVLQKENKLKSFYLFIAFFVVATAIIIAVLIWNNIKRTRKLSRRIQQKNEDLQKTLSSLEQSHQENNRIIRIVAHDLKNPISAVNNLVYSLLKKNYSEELTETLTLIKTACSSSMALIKEVLNENKTTNGLKKELVDMKGLLEYCIDLLQPKADEKEQELHLVADEVVVALNRQKMWRVVSNIVNNAIKFSPQGAVIDIKLQRKEASVLLSVHDAGIGIPAEMKETILKAPAESARQGTNGEESYGLGLSISQAIVEEHQGRLWFDSAVSKGSVFYVELPYYN